MAGPFGFEADKFEVSKKIAGQGLLPAVEAAGPTTIIVADGFSCREQILQLGHTRALHFAEGGPRAVVAGVDTAQELGMSLRYHGLKIGVAHVRCGLAFEIAEDKIAAFEAAYGPKGAWAELFRLSPDYSSTELLRDSIRSRQLSDH